MKLNVKCVGVVSLLVLCQSGYPQTGMPEWNHSEQAQWGALEDSSFNVAPLMYPFAECSLGSNQSPVDLSVETYERPSVHLAIAYDQEGVPDFFNNGHTVQVNLPPAYPGRLFVNREPYPLIQFHFHAPSEHTFGAKKFPAEIHFVHVRGDGKMAVLAIFVDDANDSYNPEFQKVLDNEPTTPGIHNTGTKAIIRPTELLPKKTIPFYSYAGSLTTPPCNEGVNWYVIAEPVQVSKQQIGELVNFAQYLEGPGVANNRMPQNLNGRTVEVSPQP